MKSFYSTDVKQLARHIKAWLEEGSMPSAFLFAAAESMKPNNGFSSVLGGLSKPLIGGVFPELIWKGERRKKGFLLLTLPCEMQAEVISFENEPLYLKKIFEAYFPTPNSKDATLFVFADAFSPAKHEFLESLYTYFGTELTYMGGGAGDLTFTSFPCLFTEKGIHQHAAVLGYVAKKIPVGAAHGWHQITEPMVVTEADGNIVSKINSKPAFGVYKEIVEKHSGKSFRNQPFFELARSYPFGLIKDNGLIVRDPVSVDGERIYIVDEIKEGEKICVMHGDMDSLLDGARTALESARNGSEAVNGSIFCADCISRVLFMQDRFSEELHILKGEGEINGILSIGEIANSGESKLEVLNKTVVVSRWNYQI